MRLNLPRIKRFARRLTAGHTFITALAERSWTICPEETITLPKAICLDGAMGKVSGLSPWRNWDLERMLVEGGPKTYHPSKRYLVRDVDIVGSYCYAGTAAHQVGHTQELFLVPGEYARDDRDKANLVTTWGSSHFFGPLLIDDFPLELLGENPAEDIRMICKPYGHEPAYRQLLGLSHSPIVKYGRVKQLTMYSEPSNNSSKAVRYATLRSRLRQALGLNDRIDRPGVYLRRGATGERRILENEREVEALMQSIGFDIVEPAGMSVADIARRTMDARIVVSVEGSHLSHVVFTMAGDGVLFVLQPPDRFATVYKEYTDCVGMRFAFVVCDKSSGGFVVNLDDFRRTLDLVA